MNTHQFFRGFATSLIAVSFVSCSSMASPNKEEKQKIELSINRVRTDLEDVKHDLNTYEIEHHMLEGKLSDHEQTLQLLQKETLEVFTAKVETLLNQVESLQNELDSIKKKQKQIVGDVSELSNHANETTSALSQYKGKIESLEKSMETFDTKFDQIAAVKQTLQELVELQKAGSQATYTVKVGDSLEKIAKKFNTSVPELKKMNGRANDLIMVGEEIQVPARSE